MKKSYLHYFFSKSSKVFRGGSTTLNGRNFLGQLCVKHRGGGNNKKYRIIDFHRRINQFGSVYKIVYDPNRNSFIGLVFYDNGLLSYIILSDKVDKGKYIFSGDDNSVIKNFNLEDESFYGSSFPLGYMPLFTIVNNVENRPYFGSSLARAAGTGLIIVASSESRVYLKSKSGWILAVSNKCIGALGFVSNGSFKMQSFKKAGKSRGMGWRPVVRGVAMNPCDHPHGGGEGKKGSPRQQKSPWGKLTKGIHTKNRKKDKLKRRLFKKIR